MHLHSSDEADRLSRIIKLLETEQVRRADEVSQLREKVRQMAKDATGKDPFAAAAETKLVTDPLSELQMQLGNAEVERTIAEAQLQAFKETIASMEVSIPSGVVERGVDERPEVKEIRDRIIPIRPLSRNTRQSCWMEKNTSVTSSSPSSWLKIRNRLDQTRAKVRNEIRIEMRTMVLNRRQDDVVELEKNVDRYKILEKVLKERCEAGLSGRTEYSGATLDLEFARSELARAEAVHDQISDRIVTLKTEQRAPERVDLMRSHDAKGMPVELLPTKQISLLCLALFGLPFSLAVGWELIARRVGDADRLEQDAHLPVVGEIASLPSRNGRFYGSGTRHMARGLEVFEESIDSLRTSLVLADSLRDMKVILVTSAVSGEGKTSVAVQLAVSLARAVGEANSVGRWRHALARHPWVA